MNRYEPSRQFTVRTIILAMSAVGASNALAQSAKSDDRAKGGSTGVLLPAKSDKALDPQIAAMDLGELVISGMQDLLDVEELSGPKQVVAFERAGQKYERAATLAAELATKNQETARALREKRQRLGKEEQGVTEALKQLNQLGAQVEQQLEQSRKRAEESRERAAKNADSALAKASARREFAQWKQMQKQAERTQFILSSATTPATIVTSQVQMLDLRIVCMEAEAASYQLASASYSATAKALTTISEVATTMDSDEATPVYDSDSMAHMMTKGTKLSPDDEREFEAWVSKPATVTKTK